MNDQSDVLPLSIFCINQISILFFIFPLGTADNKRIESTDSHSSDVTVKWKDTTDVEFSMGRVDSQNNSAPDAWCVVCFLSFRFVFLVAKINVYVQQ